MEELRKEIEALKQKTLNSKKRTALLERTSRVRNYLLTKN
jgi:hypothetical protein